MLSEVKIDALLKEAIRSYLASASYAKLRNNCLDRAAIIEVVAHCKTQLDNIVIAAKDEISTSLTEKTYRAQVAEDLETQKRDQKEAEEDSKLDAKFREQLGEIRKTLQTLDGKIQAAENHISLLQARIADCTQRIMRLSHPSQPLIHEHAGTPKPHEHPTDHSHPAHTREHGHDDTTLHLHENTTTEIPTNLDQKRQLEIQRGELRTQLQLAIDCKIIMIDEAKKLTQHKAQIEKKLREDLVPRKLARTEREGERTARQQETQSNSGPEKRLSAGNFKALTISIHRKYDEMEIQKTSLMLQVIATCYVVFLNYLKVSMPSHLKLQDKHALKQIIDQMQNFLKISKQRGEAETTLNQLHETLEKNENELKRSKERRSTLKKPNPGLKTENKAIEDQNEQLTQNIEQRRQYRNKLLKSGGYAIIFTSGATGAAFLALNFLSVMTTLIPLLFIPALASGIIGLGFFISSLAYTVKNYIDSNQIEVNKVTIANNETNFTNQQKELSDLEASIPTLEQQNMDTKADIGKTIQRIGDLKDQEILILGKASAITVIEGVIAMPVAQPVRRASAPDLSEAEVVYSVRM